MFIAVFLWLLAFQTDLAATPRLEVSWSGAAVRPGKPFHLTVTARWEGDASGYVLGPPRADLPEGLQAAPVSSQSFRWGEENVIRFQWEITAPRPVLLPGFPIHLDVFKAGVDEPVPETVFTEPLLVDIARWRGAARAKLLAVAGAGTLLLAGFTTWIVKARKRRGLAREGVFTEDGERSLERLTRLGEALNACRVRGDTLGFLQAALEIHRHAQNMETPESREIRQRMEQARYGGLRLTGEEMDAHHRRLRRLLKPAGKT